MKNKEEPHVRRRGWLKNGNPPGDFHTSARCGAKTRQKTLCKQPAMKNGRCRLHGGKSTGPKTKTGKEKCRKARLIHGYYSQPSIVKRKKARKMIKEFRDFLSEM